VQRAKEAAAEELGGNGRVVLRKSGTEPVVRVLAEAPDLATCHAVIRKITDIMDSKGYIEKNKETSSDGVF
jgi:phosphoglucosamine mutase